jgi:enoyl-[acyl-carrier-protein] reductase (NADH)
MGSNSGFLTGKKLLITGVLSNRSIAYGIAKACHAQGAELAFSYVGERFKDRITEFAADFDSKLIFDCDVGSDEQIDKMTALSTLSVLPHANPFQATSWKAYLARVSRLRTTLALIASQAWPKRRCHT